MSDRIENYKLESLIWLFGINDKSNAMKKSDHLVSDVNAVMFTINQYCWWLTSYSANDTGFYGMLTISCYCLWLTFCELAMADILQEQRQIMGSLIFQAAPNSYE